LDGSDAVEVRSARSGRLLTRAPLGGAPHDVAFDPTGERVWFSNWESPVLTVAGAGSLRRLGSMRVGTEPHHFAFGHGRLWATDNASGTVERIDPRRRRILGRTRVGPAPHHVATTGRHVLVAVNGSGRVAIVSRSGRLQQRLAVGGGPHGISAVRMR
jgi:streptogramin lyase